MSKKVKHQTNVVDIVGIKAPDSKQFSTRGDELRHLIAIARSNLTTLETELEAYSKAISPIQKVPPEILSMIFKDYLFQNHHMIRRLLRISRQWHHVVVSNPTLWTEITLCMHPFESDLAAFVEEVTPYVVACLQRSRSSLLHVSLGLAPLHSLNTIEHRVLATSMMSIHNGGNGIVPLSGLEPSMENREHIKDLFYTLAGRDGEHIRRWETLHIQLPKSGTINKQILEVLSGSAPQLRHLSIYGTFKFSRFMDNVTQTVIKDDLKDLRSLTSVCLCLRDVADFSRLPLQHAIITEMELETSLDIEDVATLEKFQGLHKLRLIARVNNDSFPPASTLRLSRLEEISFLGPYKGLDRITYDLPILRHLYINPAFDAKVFDGLPGVRAKHVHFTLPTRKDERKGDQEAKAVILKVIKQYPDVTSLTVHSYLVTKSKQYLTQLKEEGLISMDIETSVTKDSLDSPWTRRAGSLLIS